MSARIPDDIRAAILADIRASGHSRARLARDHGVSPDTISRIAREAGVDQPFARTMTKNAVEAVQADNRAARAREAAGSIHDAQTMRERALLADTARDAKDYAIAYGILVDKHAVLTRIDADPGVESARSLLGDLGRALGVAADQIPPP